MIQQDTNELLADLKDLQARKEQAYRLGRAVIFFGMWIIASILIFVGLMIL